MDDHQTKALYAKPIPATRSGSLYNAFPYPTKISPEYIALFIAAHTRPGQTVFDGFAGSGTTGVAAKLCEQPTQRMREAAERLGLNAQWGGRNAVLCELSVLGSFIARTLTDPPNPEQFREAAESLLREVENAEAHLYDALSPSGELGRLRYIVWSDLVICPQCDRHVTLWDACVSKMPASISSTFSCPHCGHSAPTDSVERVTAEEYDPILGSVRRLRQREPAWVYGVTNGNYWSRRATKDDLERHIHCKDMPPPASVPIEPIPWGDLYRSGYHAGITHLHHFYTPRNLRIFSTLWEQALTHSGRIQDALRFWLLSYNAAHATIMTRVVAKKDHDDLVVTSGQPGVLYVSGLPVEKNLFAGLRRKLTTIVDAFRSTYGLHSTVEVHERSCCSLDLASHSVDYAFTDPPFGANIPYAEVNFVNEAWLGRHTERSQEAIVSPAQHKGVDEYQELLRRAFSELFRVLKHEGQVTLVFHSANARVWNALHSAYRTAGFDVHMTSILDKTQSSFKQVTTKGAVKGDPLLLLQKTAPETVLERNASVWEVADELRRQAACASDPAETTPERLYSRLVGHFLMRGESVPVDAKFFYQWLANESGSS